MTGEHAFKSRTFVRDRRTWIATLLTGAALWVGTSVWLNRHVPLAARRAAGQDEGGRLVVLAFDRIVRAPDGDHLDRSRLRDALRALSRAGWQAVTLGEVRAAYVLGARLPAQPLLLTFDEGYLSTYEAADPVLRELRWPAVMFLRTERQDRRDVSFLFWDRLKRMTGSGLWAVASGDPPDGNPRTIARSLPPEPPGARRIASMLGSPEVVAWAPRGADPLAALGCEDGARDAVPWLGFADDVAGAAPPDGNPFRIPRLRVVPTWTTSELMSRIDRAVASAPPFSPAGRPAPLGDGWISGEGTVTADGTSLRLAGAPRAEVWIPAARFVDDWELTARIVPGDGEFWIVQPEETRAREWRIGGAGGNLYVEVKAPGQTPEVLAKEGGVATSARAHTLRIIKRGRGILAVWDGTPISAGPIALPGRWRAKLGIVAYGGAGTASLSVSDLRFSAYPYSVRATSASPSAAEVGSLAHDAESIAAISPPWATVDQGLVREKPFDRDLLRILSRKFAWDVLPGVLAFGVEPEDPQEWARALARRAAEERFDGLSLHLEEVSGEAGEGWSSTARAVEQALRRSGMRLLVTKRPAPAAGTR